MVAHLQNALGPETAPQTFGDLGQCVAGLCQYHQPLAGVVRQTVLEDAPGGLGFGVLAAQASVELTDGGPFLEVLAGVLVQGLGVGPCPPSTEKLKSGCVRRIRTIRRIPTGGVLVRIVRRGFGSEVEFATPRISRRPILPPGIPLRITAPRQNLRVDVP